MFDFATIRGALGAAPQGRSLGDLVESAAQGLLTLIDVRGHDEVAAYGKAEGAIHIPLMLLPHHADPRHPEFHAALSVERPVGVYCASGARSSMAENMLRQLGYGEVTNIGGLGDWVRAGGAVER